MKIPFTNPHKPCCAQQAASFGTRFAHLATACTLALAAMALPVVSHADKEPVQVKNRIPIEPVLSDHWVGFALLIDGDTEYAAYYNANREMTVASRKLGSSEWTKQPLPSFAGYDSHNYIALGTDRDGHLHVSGNMHGHPLVYFRTQKPGDVTTLKQYGRMIGDQEQRVTYPKFLRAANGDLIYIYRDGSSGDGADIYNRYNEQNKRWERLLDQPLVDGRAKDPSKSMNAYIVGPQLGPDGYYHATWVWRDTPAAETCHDLSYARSKDLVNWETIDGRPLSLPITIQSEGVIVDPIPVNGGIINGSGRIGFDDQNRPVIAYHKFDAKGATQLYLARFEDGKWNSHQITDWDHRWEPKGRGTLIFDVHHSGLLHAPGIGYYITMNNAKHGGGAYRVDPQTLQLGEKIDPRLLPGYRPTELNNRLGSDPRLQVRVASVPEHLGWHQPEGERHILRWETLSINKDRPHPDPQPEPVMLELIELLPVSSDSN